MISKHYRVIDINDDHFEYLCESKEELNDVIMDIIEHLGKDEAAVLDIREVSVEEEVS